MPELRAPFVILSVLFANFWAYAQVPDPSSERTMWDHNGSMMYLIANGSSREIFYEKPRSGMGEAGAKAGYLLFRGEVSNGQYSGTAYIFNPQCGQVPLDVKGAIFDDGKRIVLTGQAPRIARNCRAIASYSTTLEFRLLKTIANPSPPETKKAEEPIAEARFTDAKTLDTSLPSPPVSPPANGTSSPTKEVTANMARLPLDTPFPKHSEKTEFVGDNFETYISAVSAIIVVAVLLFFLARQVSKKQGFH